MPSSSSFISLVKCYLNYRFELENLEVPFLTHTHPKSCCKQPPQFFITIPEVNDRYIVSDCCFSRADQLARLFKTASELELSLLDSTDLDIEYCQ